MKLEKPGADISVAEIVHISSHGFWLLVNGKEYFLDYTNFPWFREATIGQISAVETSFGRIFRWPQLDVDLDLDRIEHPEKYPLVSQQDT